MPSFNQKRFALICLLVLAFAGTTQAWWNAEWTIRQKMTVDPAAVSINGLAGATPVLLRLHDGNFQFAAAKEDGSDIRFVAADDKTQLPCQIEKYDSLLNEAFIWVQVPEGTPGAPNTFYLYYGSASDNPARPAGKGAFDADSVLVWHFGEKGAPADSSGSGITGSGTAVSVEGSLIGNGLRLDGAQTITIPASPALNVSEGGNLTFSLWIKPAALTPNAVLYSRHDGTNAFLIGLDNGVPYTEVASASGTQRSAPAADATPIAANVWRHLAITAAQGQITVYLDGKEYAALATGLPALTTASLLGNDGTPDVPADPNTPTPKGFAGEMDELEISKVARPAAYLQFANLSQNGSDQSGKLIVAGTDEAHGSEGELTKQLSLITDISKSLTFDGWIVIFLCALLALIGWVVAIDKLIYLGKIKKCTGAFLDQWKLLSSDLTALDHGDKTKISTFGGKASAKKLRLIHQSPLYHIYHLGSEEIHHRIIKDNFRGLSGRSMQAIRATLDGGLTREVQNLNNRLVFLTIGIAGGPYLGLLGTVIGVMITFAVIAKSGAVEVNSIAPGIAGALLATVAGLAVAIPALFAYSYVSSRIKDVVSEMQIFIDEFVAKIAEFYPPVGE